VLAAVGSERKHDSVGTPSARTALEPTGNRERRGVVKIEFGIGANLAPGLDAPTVESGAAYTFGPTPTIQRSIHPIAGRVAYDTFLSFVEGPIGEQTGNVFGRRNAATG